MLSDLAFHFAGREYDVHVITSRSSDGELRLETIRGVTVHRVSRSMTGPHSLGQRAMAYLRFYSGARRAVRALIVPGDILVLKTDPPLLSSAVGPLAKRLGAKVVVWLQDLFPEVAHAYGVPGMGWPIGTALRRARDHSLATADQVVPICDGMAMRINEIPLVDRGKVRVIHNWADGDAITPIDAGSNPLRRQWNLVGVFVVGYSGNLGRVHEFDTILEAAAILRSQPGICFLIVGRGPRLEEVRGKVKARGLPNVRFEAHQDRTALSQSLGIADVHLSVLRAEFEGLVHPSKLYGIMAAGRPTLFIGDPNGETASILRRSGAGLSVATGDARGLAASIRMLHADNLRRDAMGRAARREFDASYSMSNAMHQWESLLIRP